MPFCTSPKNELVNQAAQKSSYYIKLISCVIVLLSSLTIIQVFLVYKETRINHEDVDLSVKIIEQNSSYAWNGTIYPKLDSGKIGPLNSRLDHNDLDGKFGDSTPRMRRHDFIPSPQSPVHMGPSSISMHSSENKYLALPVQDQQGKSSGDFVVLDILSPPKQDKSVQDLRGLENMGESTSETISRGTMMLKSGTSPKINKFARSLDDSPEPAIESETDDEASREDLGRDVDERSQGASSDDGMPDMDIHRVKPSASRGAEEPAAIPSNESLEQQTDSDIERTGSGATNQLKALDLMDDDGDDDMRDEGHNVVGPQANTHRKVSPETSGTDHGMMDQIPESMDSLMNSSEQEDLVDLSDEKNSPSENHHYQVGPTKPRMSQKISGSPSRPAAATWKRSKDPDEDDNDDMKLDDDEGRKLPMVAHPRQETDKDLSAAAGHYHNKKKKHHDHGHDYGKYYMYAKVPKKKSWEFGFKRGNKKHWIERHEKGHKNKFKTKVKWYDEKSKGKGVHIWDYNHHDKKKHH